MTSRFRLIAVALVLACAVAAAAAYAMSGHGSRPTSTGSPIRSGSSPSRSGAAWVPTSSAYADVCQSRLPSQARDTLALIARGGPYPYRSDGVVFENRESRLPKQRGGYYHEFTVVTPGSDDRGTRRVVTGSAGEEYWTGDHYDSFQEIDVRC